MKSNVKPRDGAGEQVPLISEPEDGIVIESNMTNLSTNTPSAIFLYLYRT